jgi:glycosyltransferase involved in cell wall biosynthesis
MRLGFITLGKNVPSTRFRFLAYRPYLRQRGHDLHCWTSWPSAYEALPGIGWRASQLVKRTVRWSQWLHCRTLRPDCIYLERGVYHHADACMDRRFRNCTRRLVLDVDDAIFLEFPQKIPELIRMSDHVVAANPALLEYVAQYTDSVTLIPTSIDLERYTAKDVTGKVPGGGHTAGGTRLAGPPVVIGWMGTAPNVAFLEVCAPALRQLARSHHFELLVVAPDAARLAAIDLSGVTVRFEPWGAEREVPLLHAMDIGIMPLPSGREWMRYKAATKLLQYLAVGIPAVASPIGVNADILKGSRTGFAAADDKQWVQALAQLIEDRKLRVQLGNAGRELVARQFSLAVNAPVLESVLAAN